MSIPRAHQGPTVRAALFALAEDMRGDGDLDLALYGPFPKAEPPLGRSLAVFVGWPGASTRPQPVEGFTGAATYQQTVDVRCSALSYSGGTDVARHDTAVHAIWDGVRSRIEADPTLGGACEYARMGQVDEAYPMNEGGGASVELQFAVTVVAFV